MQTLIRKTTLFALLISLLTLAVPAGLVGAQEPATPPSTEPRTFTVTEAELNASFAVENPIRRRVSDLSLDIQDGQVQVTAQVNLRNGETATMTATYVPSVVNGDLRWTRSGSIITDPAITSPRDFDGLLRVYYRWLMSEIRERIGRALW
ncbi:MAG: hypothetical protein HC915_10955 [Anaerolineae bacterium]|nr:hypothetical protein [Anaerolineae bacterium]